MTDASQAAACLNKSRSDSKVPLFRLGKVLATPGALDTLETLQLTPMPFLLRHASGDCGDICAEDQQANADALLLGSRLMSVYVLSAVHRLWVITEADRSYTTLLLPEED